MKGIKFFVFEISKVYFNKRNQSYELYHLDFIEFEIS